MKHILNPDSNCEICGNKIKPHPITKHVNKRFCSAKCRDSFFARMPRTTTCLVCSKLFKQKRGDDQKFCSPGCYWSTLKGRFKGENSPCYKGRVARPCARCGKVNYYYPSRIKEGKKYFCPECIMNPAVTLICPGCNTKFAKNYSKQRYCSASCYHKYNPYWLGKERLSMRVPPRETWRANRKILRERAEYQNWIKGVFARDNYTCRSCGKRGGKLVADHIKPSRMHPNLFLDINNGQTLCSTCHSKKTSSDLKILWKVGIFTNNKVSPKLIDPYITP